jgi:hypothetical protein
MGYKMTGFTGFGEGTTPIKQKKLKEGKSKTTDDGNVSTNYWDPENNRANQTTTSTELSGWPKDKDVVARNKNVSDLREIDVQNTSKVKVDKDGKKFIVSDQGEGNMYSVDLMPNVKNNTKQTETRTTTKSNMGEEKGSKRSRTGYKVNNTYFDGYPEFGAVSDTLVLPKHLQGKYKKGDDMSEDDFYSED